MHNMHRFIVLLVFLLLGGCGDPSATAPMLTLNVENQNGTIHAIGSYRVFNTGVLSESGDVDGNGQGESQRVTINKIADDGVTLTFEMSGRSGEEFKREIFLRHNEEIKVDLANQSTLVAKLETRQ